MGITHFISSSSIFFFFIFLCPSQCSSLSFSIANNFTLYGDANFIKDAITLTTQEHSLQPSKRYGRALYRYPIRFLDPLTNTTASFSCRFSFTITTSPVSPCGDGLAFFITSNASSITTVSGDFGLPIHEMGSQESFFAVEFDTNFDPNLGDINDNHVGIDFDSVVSFASVGLDFWGINLKIGREITAWIQYEEKTKLLSVWVSNSQFKPRDPVISIYIDLSQKVFQEFMHIGFSASNRREGSSRHVVESWQFNTSGLVSPKTGTEAGCSLCFHTHEAFTVQDGSLHRQPIEESQKIGKAALALGGGGGALMIFTTVVALFLLKWVSFFKTQEPRRFSLKEIVKATKGFSQKIGGSTADVFKGSLGYRKTIAVKRFQCIDSFNREKEALRVTFPHRNIIRCTGWCEEEDVKVLVFEYMEGGSLRGFLPLKYCPGVKTLSWHSRQKIVTGVASALAYMHREGMQVIHGSIGASNILLDNRYKAKLSDFSLAVFRVGGSTPSQEGYAEDVFHFGVVALETATGLTELGNKYMPSQHVRWDTSLADAYNKELVNVVRERKMSAADVRLKGHFHKKQMERMIRIGLLCTLDDPKARPTMEYVDSFLKGPNTWSMASLFSKDQKHLLGIPSDI